MRGSDTVVVHRHGHHVHGHPYARPHRHLLLLRRSRPIKAHEHPHDHEHHHADGSGGHGHSHGLIDRSIVRSHEGVKAVSITLAVLALAAVAQLAIFALAGSVALLADLIHNFGDALTAVPLGIALRASLATPRSGCLYRRRDERDDCRQTIEDAGFTLVSVRENEHYRFVSERADNATQKYGVKSISLLALKTT